MLRLRWIHDRSRRNFEILPLRGDAIDYGGSYYPACDIVTERDFRLERLEVAATTLHRFDAVRETLRQDAAHRSRAAQSNSRLARSDSSSSISG